MTMLKYSYDKLSENFAIKVYQYEMKEAWCLQEGNKKTGTQQRGADGFKEKDNDRSVFDEYISKCIKKIG